MEEIHRLGAKNRMGKVGTIQDGLKLPVETLGETVAEDLGDTVGAVQHER